MSNTKILNLAEYTSLGLSVLGTMVAATTGQAAFAATPLTLALSLNLFNRQMLAKRTQHNKNNISHLKQEFSRDINTLSNNINSVRDLPFILSSSKETINLNKLDKILLEIQQTTRQLKEKVNDLEVNFNNLPVEKELIDLTQIEEAIASLNQQLNSLGEQFNNRLEPREIENIKDKLTLVVTYQEFNQISEEIQAISSSLDSNYLEDESNLTSRLRVLDLRTNVIKNQLEELVKIEYLEQELVNFSDNFTGQINTNIEQAIQSFNQLIKENQPVYTYELISDRDGSRKVLIEALQTTQSRIILVCPWITSYGADDQIIQCCRAFLAQGGIIDVGWGHLKDINQTQHISISRDEFLRIAKNRSGWAYSQLEKFIELEQQYPDKMNLKLLGTHEKFLVCDRTFAMIGSHNFLTSNCHSTERELGIRTNDKNIIEDLIRRFETAPCLDEK
jgi:PLD-like domain